MDTQRLYILFIMFCFLSTGTLGFCNNQDEVAELKFESTFFDLEGLKFSRLISLDWDGEQLRLRRDWAPAPEREDEPGAGENLHLRRLKAMMPETAVEYAFGKVAMQIGCQSRGRSGSGGSMLLTARSDNYLCTARIDGDDYRFTFQVREKPLRRMVVERLADKRLDIVYSLPTGQIICSQDSKGRAAIVVLVDGTNAVYSGNSFRELLKENPEVGDSIFWPLIDHLEIGRPFDRSSVEVQDFVKNWLLTKNHTLSPAIEDVVKKLNAKKFRERSAAMDSLRRNFEKWSEDLNVLAKDESLPIESRMRIKKIIKESKVVYSNNKKISEFVVHNKLLADDEYLFSLADESNKKLFNAVLRQVQENNASLDLEGARAKFQTWKLGR